jgi:hypothetical protein
MLRAGLASALAVGLLLAGVSARAADDPPGRVGRLTQVEGDVTFRSDRRDEGGPARINWPVSSGAVIETGRRGRAEIWVGSTAWRTDRDSRTEFVAVDDRRVAVFQGDGRLAVTIRDRDQTGDIEVSTPDARVRFSSPGRYRVDVTGNQTVIAAQSGEAVVSAGQTIRLRAGEMAEVASGALQGVAQARYGDDFDDWVTARDRLTEAPAARRHVSPYMTGYQDLDAYGDWGAAGEYGTVWYPRAVSSDWAPYRYGRWVWVAPWGWTWVDNAPWGFAPFHYGRWVVIRGRWAWVPGAWVARPLYAPALVAWIGDPGWNVSFAFGAAPAVGWFPLAPREVYVPGYRVSTTYVRQINVTHVSNVREIERATGPGYRPAYAHRERADAVTVVPATHLREGRPVDRAAIARPEPRELGRAPVAARSPGFDGRPAGSGRGDSPRRDEANGQSRSSGTGGGVRPEQAMPRGGEPIDRPLGGERPLDRGSDDRGRYDPARRSEPQGMPPMPEAQRDQPSTRPPSAVREPLAPPPREVQRNDRISPDLRQDPVRQFAPRPEPQRMDAPQPQPRFEPPRVEPPRMEAPRPAPRIEQPRIDAPQPAQPRYESPRMEPPRQPSGDGGPGRGRGGRQDER